MTPDLTSAGGRDAVDRAHDGGFDLGGGGGGGVGAESRFEPELEPDSVVGSEGDDASDDGSTPSYVLTRKRMKHLRMTVKAPHGTVHVSAPVHARQREIDAFVSSRREWIRKQQQLAVDMPAPLSAGPEADRLRREMRESVPPLMEYWADRMALEVPTLTLRRMTTRWGTCNKAKRHVTLNLELGRRDSELLEYVIVHELAHLYEPNHSKRFYAVMDKFLPDWQDKRRELNRR